MDVDRLHCVVGTQHNLTDLLVTFDARQQTDEHGHDEEGPAVTRFDHRGWRDECMALGCRPDQGISMHAFTTVLYGNSHHPVTGPLPWRALWHGVQKDGLERDVERYVERHELWLDQVAQLGILFVYS